MVCDRTTVYRIEAYHASGWFTVRPPRRMYFKRGWEAGRAWRLRPRVLEYRGYAVCGVEPGDSQW
jgi:hypothetical protein